MTGANASLTVDGVNLTSASNTVTNLIPGVTFQLLSISSEPVQLVIGNDNTDVESTVNQFVTDYNSLISAINTQEGNTSSGTPEPLFGSPTLSLLQQQILGSVNTQNPNGYLDAITQRQRHALRFDQFLAGRRHLHIVLLGHGGRRRRHLHRARSHNLIRNPGANHELRDDYRSPAPSASR